MLGDAPMLPLYYRPYLIAHDTNMMNAASWSATLAKDIYLQTVSLGLGFVSVGAFLDDNLSQVIDIDGKEEAAIYLQATGAL